MASLPSRSPLEAFSAFLENYWSRNQVLRTLQFASALCAGLLEGRRRANAAAKFSTVSTSIANARVLLRLLDDLPVLVHTLKSWRPNKVCMILCFNTRAYKNSCWVLLDESLCNNAKDAQIATANTSVYPI